MSPELCKHRADAQQTLQHTLTQFLVILIVTIMLVTPLVARCAGSVANPASSSPTTSTTLKTPKVSPTQPLATTPVHSVARSDENSSGLPPLDSAIWDNALLGAATIIAAFVGAGATLAAALLYEIPAAFISGNFLLIAALIGIIPGILTILIALK